MSLVKKRTSFFLFTNNFASFKIKLCIVLVAIVKKRLKIDQSLYTILKVLSISLFEKMPNGRALATTSHQEPTTIFNNQLKTI